MTATLCLPEDLRHQSQCPHYKPNKNSTHMGGLAWIFNCIRYLAGEIEVISLENDKINRTIEVPHPLELPFAIHGGRDLAR